MSSARPFPSWRSAAAVAALFGCSAAPRGSVSDPFAAAACPSPAPVIITAPANLAAVAGSTTISASGGAGVTWYRFCVDPSAPGGDCRYNHATELGSGPAASWDASGATPGYHVLQADGFDGGTLIGSAQIAVVVGRAAPAHYATLPPRAALPTAATCAAAVDAAPLPEAAPWNRNIPPPGDVAGYFYQYVDVANMPASDFAAVDGSYRGTTDDIARVYACKWGIDENLVRAQMMNETGWHQDAPGDYDNPAGCRTGLPVTSITPGGQFCALQGFGPATAPHQYASWSIVQVKVAYEWFTWPMINQSTSFAVDFRYAQMRGCINGDQYTYFHSQNAASGADYQNAVAAATEDPSGFAAARAISGALLKSDETNLEYLAWGCFGTHFSGDWYSSGAADYNQKGYRHYLAADWPGHQR